VEGGGVEGVGVDGESGGGGGGDGGGPAVGGGAAARRAALAAEPDDRPGVLAAVNRYSDLMSVELVVVLVAYLLNIRILGPVAPLTGQYSRGGLN